MTTAELGNPTEHATLGLHIFDPRLDCPTEPVIFEGLISSTDLAVWIGREKHRKTNVLLQLAICAATGRDFLNFRFAAPKPLRVVFIDYESKTSGLKNRYERITTAMLLLDAERDVLRRNLQIIEVRKMRQEGKKFHRFPLAENEKANAEFWKRLIAENPADLYIIDPMRCFHAGAENDSKIEALLEGIRTVFRTSAVIVSHHMRKKSSNGSKGDDFHDCSLRGGMREWSDGARGSGAIKAHADVIACQERVIEGETEVVYLGAFMKDGPDIEPIPLVETDNESFLFAPSRDVPSHLRKSFDALKKYSNFCDKSAAVAALLSEIGGGRSTAFRHVGELTTRGLLVASESGWRVNV